jgi:hypothetical protein
MSGYLLLKLAADFAVVHMTMLVLQACRIQQLQGHGGFHPDFKGQLGSHTMCGRVKIPTDSL